MWVPRRNNRESEPIEGDVATIGTVLNLWNFGVNNGAAVTVLGDMNNSGGIDLEVRSLLRVNGNLQNSGSMTTSFFGNTGGNTISVGGLLTNQNSGNITLYGLGDALHANGGLINNGFVQVLNGSSVDQPFLGSLGIVGIDNTSKFVVGTGAASGQGYIQLVNGTLGEMITTSDFGQIYVIGSVSLNGTLDIMLQSGFNPPVGTSYDIILFSPSGLTGTFATIQNDIFNNGTEMWLLTYDNAGGLVELTAEAHVVPEPGSLLMLLSGVMAAGYGFRRKLL